MARIRTIKPEFWEDEKLAKFPIHARLLFIFPCLAFAILFTGLSLSLLTAESFLFNDARKSSNCPISKCVFVLICKCSNVLMCACVYVLMHLCSCVLMYLCAYVLMCVTMYMLMCECVNLLMC